MKSGLNLEFAKKEGLSLYEAMVKSHEMGYRYVEPYVYSAAEMRINSHLTLATKSDYHHINTEQADARQVHGWLKELDLQFSAIDAHSTLLLPQIGVPYLKRAIDFAHETECPIVMSDEGPMDAWMPFDRAYDIMCMCLEEIIPYAQRQGVRMAIELHNPLTTNKESLVKLMKHFNKDELGINFDTGNSFLAGNDPVEMLDGIADRVVQVHAKDIPEWQLVERGKVTGTRVGVAIGDGVIDFPGVVQVMRSVGYDGVFSVECDSAEEAAVSVNRLNELFR